MGSTLTTEKLDVVIVSAFSSDFGEGDNSRFKYLAQMLSATCNVEVVASDFNHSAKQHFANEASDAPYRVTRLHEPGYPINVCPQRLVSHSVFARSLAKYLATRRVPDVVYCAVPPLQSSMVAARYCKGKDVRFVIDVQDLWPEAFQMVFDMPLLSQLAFKPLSAMADKVYGSAAEICAVSQTYADRALCANRACDEAHVVYLGTDLEVFDHNAQVQPCKEKQPGELWLGYCGTLGASYDIETVLYALHALKIAGGIVPRFIVMGDGPKRAAFEDLANELAVDVTFVGRLGYPDMCAILARCDMAVNPISRGAAQSVINKHADYAAAGLPVLNTQESEEYRWLVEERGMGINVPNGDAITLSAAIDLLCKDAALREQLGKASRCCAEECFDRRRSYGELVATVVEEVSR